MVAWPFSRATSTPALISIIPANSVRRYIASVENGQIGAVMNQANLITLRMEARAANNSEIQGRSLESTQNTEAARTEYDDLGGSTVNFDAYVRSKASANYNFSTGGVDHFVMRWVEHTGVDYVSDAGNADDTTVYTAGLVTLLATPASLNARLLVLSAGGNSANAINNGVSASGHTFYFKSAGQTSYRRIQSYAHSATPTATTLTIESTNELAFGNGDVSPAGGGSEAWSIREAASLAPRTTKIAAATANTDADYKFMLGAENLVATINAPVVSLPSVSRPTYEAWPAVTAQGTNVTWYPSYGGRLFDIACTSGAAPFSVTVVSNNGLDPLTVTPGAGNTFAVDWNTSVIANNVAAEYTSATALHFIINDANGKAAMYSPVSIKHFASDPDFTIDVWHGLIPNSNAAVAGSTDQAVFAQPLDEVGDKWNMRGGIADNHEVAMLRRVAGTGDVTANVALAGLAPVSLIKTGTGTPAQQPLLRDTTSAPDTNALFVTGQTIGISTLIHNENNAAWNLSALAPAAGRMREKGQLQVDYTANATTITLSATASPNDDHYNGKSITLYDGTTAYGPVAITDYNGTTKVATLGAALHTALIPFNASFVEYFIGNYDNALAAAGASLVIQGVQNINTPRAYWADLGGSNTWPAASAAFPAATANATTGSRPVLRLMVDGGLAANGSTIQWRATNTQGLTTLGQGTTPLGSTWTSFAVFNSDTAGTGSTDKGAAETAGVTHITHIPFRSNLDAPSAGQYGEAGDALALEVRDTATGDVISGIATYYNTTTPGNDPGIPTSGNLNTPAQPVSAAANVVQPLNLNGALAGRQIGQPTEANGLRVQEPHMTAATHPNYNIVPASRGMTFGQISNPGPNQIEGIQWLFVEALNTTGATFNATNNPTFFPLVYGSDLLSGGNNNNNGGTASATQPGGFRIYVDEAAGSARLLDNSSNTTPPCEFAPGVINGRIQSLPASIGTGGNPNVRTANGANDPADTQIGITLPGNGTFQVNDTTAPAYSMVYKVDAYDGTVPQNTALIDPQTTQPYLPSITGKVGLVFWRAGTYEFNSGNDLVLHDGSTAFAAPSTYNGYLPNSTAGTYGYRPDLTFTPSGNLVTAPQAPLNNTNITVNLTETTTNNTGTAPWPGADLAPTLNVGIGAHVYSYGSFASAAAGAPTSVTLKAASTVGPTTIKYVFATPLTAGGLNDGTAGPEESKILVNALGNLDGNLYHDGNNTSDKIFVAGAHGISANALAGAGINFHLMNLLDATVATNNANLAEFTEANGAGNNTTATADSVLTHTTTSSATAGYFEWSNNGTVFTEPNGTVLTCAAANTQFHLRVRTTAPAANTVPVRPLYLLVWTKTTNQGLLRRYRKMQWTSLAQVTAIALSVDNAWSAMDSLSFNLVITESAAPDLPVWWQLERRAQAVNTNAWAVAKASDGVTDLKFVTGPGHLENEIESLLSNLPEANTPGSLDPQQVFQYRLLASAVLGATPPSVSAFVISNTAQTTRTQAPTVAPSGSNRSLPTFDGSQTVVQAPAPAGTAWRTVNYTTAGVRSLTGVNAGPGTFGTVFTNKTYDGMRASDKEIHVNTGAADWSFMLPATKHFPTARSIVLKNTGASNLVLRPDLAGTTNTLNATINTVTVGANKTATVTASGTNWSVSITA